MPLPVTVRVRRYSQTTLSLYCSKKYAAAAQPLAIHVPRPRIDGASTDQPPDVSRRSVTQYTYSTNTVLPRCLIATFRIIYCRESILPAGRIPDDLLHLPRPGRWIVLKAPRENCKWSQSRSNHRLRRGSASTLRRPVAGGASQNRYYRAGVKTAHKPLFIPVGEVSITRRIPLDLCESTVGIAPGARSTLEYSHIIRDKLLAQSSYSDSLHPSPQALDALARQDLIPTLTLPQRQRSARETHRTVSAPGPTTPTTPPYQSSLSLSLSHSHSSLWLPQSESVAPAIPGQICSSTSG